MAAVLKPLIADKKYALTFWGNDSGIDGTVQAYVYALMRKYNVIRPYVTVDDCNRRLTSFLTKTYAENIVAATYSQLTDTIISDSPDLGYTSFIIRAKDVDAFYFSGVRGCGAAVVMFFSDPNVFKALKDKNNEFFDYPWGNYSLEEGMSGYYLLPLSMTKTGPPILDTKIMENLLLDTDIFFDSDDFYHRAGIPHKRGILLIGPAGNGKSTFIKSYLTYMQNKYGVVVDCAKYLSNSTFAYLGRALGGRPKVLIFEDVDGVCRDSSSRSAFLNFLDGVNELNNTLVIATTNFPERLDDAILDRPSRFDTLLYIGKPPAKLRKFFLLKWFPELNDDHSRLESLSIATEGFSGAYFKELFIICGLRKCDIEEGLAHLKERQRLLRLAKQGQMSNYRPEEPQHAEGMAEVTPDFSVSEICLKDLHYGADPVKKCECSASTKALHGALMAALRE